MEVKITNIAGNWALMILYITLSDDTPLDGRMYSFLGIQKGPLYLI